MRPGARVRPNNRKRDPVLGTVTRVEADGTVVIRWDRIFHSCREGCSCPDGGTNARTKFQRLRPDHAAKDLRNSR